MQLPRSILVPIDTSPHAKAALDYACALAAKLDARIHLVTAIGVDLVDLRIAIDAEVMTSLRKDRVEYLEKLAAEYRSIAPVDKRIVRTGDARDEIVAVAAELAVDLVVIGSHGRRGFSRFFLGSVSELVVRRAPCPVLVVHLPLTM